MSGDNIMKTPELICTSWSAAYKEAKSPRTNKSQETNIVLSNTDRRILQQVLESIAN